MPMRWYRNPGRGCLVQTDSGTSKGNWYQESVQSSNPQVENSLQTGAESKLSEIYLHSSIRLLCIVFRQKQTACFTHFLIKCGILDNTFQSLKIITYIQGVTGGTDQNSGECSLGHTIPI